ncbi:hypothetical protein DBN05_004202 [Salmonella enterica subsp. enterica serovar Anderlecht]|nr:hypothetical protein [Salmonella enterica subsp. enterica serovar Anderlecht]EEJ3528041.1 hypothetical protein [Salmonella enterica subsp. enterica serovar Anderlecht]MIX10345.1 hypothetical protein [Salmonella enterica subsp. enterica serovar Anderlecht]
MSIFKDEREMQEWLENELDDQEGFINLIYNIQSIDDYIPKDSVSKKLYDSYQHCIPALSLMEVISKDQNISSSKGDILKPDIVAYSIEKESLVLIELKNISGPSREAGTELSAYAGELKGYLSHLSDGDIINVIISPVWPALLKHYVFNNIVWQNKNMICFEPAVVNGEKVLKPLDIDVLLQAEIPASFSEEHLRGYHICLYDYTQYHEPRPQTKLHDQLSVIKSSISQMVAEGEKANSHGFVILTEEIIGYGLSPYMITFVNAAPFSSLERYFHSDEIKSYEDLPFIGKQFYDIYTYYEPLGLGSSTSKIFNSGRRYLSKICKPEIESLNSWKILKNEANNARAQAFYFDSWGVFKEKAMELLFEKYNNSEYDIDLNSIELGYEVISELVDDEYNFIYLPSIRPI